MLDVVKLGKLFEDGRGRVNLDKVGLSIKGRLKKGGKRQLVGPGRKKGCACVPSYRLVFHLQLESCFHQILLKDLPDVLVALLVVLVNHVVIRQHHVDAPQAVREVEARFLARLVHNTILLAQTTL